MRDVPLQRQEAMCSWMGFLALKLDELPPVLDDGALAVERAGGREADQKHSATLVGQLR